MFPLVWRRNGDGERAHDLSVEGKEHQKKQDELDDQASSWIFSGSSFLSRSPPMLSFPAGTIITLLISYFLHLTGSGEIP
jgi:hypothetical protein